MKGLSFLPVLLFSPFCILAPAGRLHAAEASGLKVQVQLVWATNDPKSPNPGHHLLDEQDPLSAKLRNTYRWTNYFEVKKVYATVPARITNMVPVSEHCQLEIVNLGGDWVDIKLFGQGKKVSTHREKVLSTWPIVMAGNSRDSNAWFVAIRKVEASDQPKPLVRQEMIPAPAIPIARPQPPRVGPMRAQVQLIWATNDPKSPNPKHYLLPEQDPLAAKLRKTYRWTNYFEVNKLRGNIPSGGTNNFPVSDKCNLEIVNLGNDWVEIKLFGQGKKVSTHRERVLADWPVVLAGHSNNSNAWFVAVKRISDTDGAPSTKAQSVMGAPAK
jgi:hypothetical protein